MKDNDLSAASAIIPIGRVGRLSGRIFRRTPAPDRFSECPVVGNASWYTWSIETKNILAAIGQTLPSYEPPGLVHLANNLGYDYTYSLSHLDLSESRILEDTKFLASELSDTDPGDGISFFSGLIDDTVSGDTLHFFFSLLRDAISVDAGSPWAALYAPLANTGEHAGDFPLHCDMYSSEILWNIFEDVAPDGSGAAIFLTTAEMLDLMTEIPSVPSDIRAAVQVCLETPSERDQFEWLYKIIHGRDNPWSQELGDRMRKRQIPVKMHRGDGYLIHDRKWLHGRETPTGGVNAKRVHRLVFSSRSATGQFKDALA